MKHALVYDVIVVGARCAGASTAMLLARSGQRVLMIDRARFPRDTLSTLYIQQAGVAHLARWGLLDEVRESGCPPLDRISYRIGDVRLAGRPRPVPDAGVAFAPRRAVLDAILARAAVRAGVEFRDGCSVEGLIREGDRVVGVHCRTGRGTVDAVRAALVVGADGMRSSVAAAVDAPMLVEDSPKTCVYYSFFAGAADHFELYEATGQWIGAVPTNDGATLVQAYFPQSAYPQVRQDAAAAFERNVRGAAPELYERMLAGGQVERLFGTGDQRNFFRTAAGPGWVLVGDAGHHRDSITARGITHAFRQAQLLTDLLRDAGGGDLADSAGTDAALAMFGKRRDEALIDDYHDTLSVAKLAVPRYRVELLREVAADPTRTEQFFSAMCGSGAATGNGSSVAATIRWLKESRRARG
jgi:2-polyprenyl-6-methoxyphenol hydroxylase-like FAD-dependent oxidoreductase